MHPILFQIGPITLRTYGALVAMAFLVALRMARWAANWRRVNETNFMDLAVLLIFSGLLGARLFYVLFNASYFLEHPLEVFKVWEGGLVFYGGFFVAAVAGLLFVKRRRMSVAVVADCVAPALALGQAIGRLGCF